MKKVVLLAGALAMGMASAPMAANAANPAVNDVQEVNLTRSQIESVLNEARVLQAKYHTVMGHARFTDASVVPADTQKKIQKAYNHVTSLIEEGEKLIDGKVNASLIFYATGVEQGEFKFNPNLSTMPEWVKDYKGLTSKSTIADLLEKQTVAYSAILASTVSYLETYDNLTALFADKTEQLRAIVNTISNLGDTVYGSDAEELLKKLQALQSDGDDTNFVDFADFQNGLSAGNLTEKVNDFMELLETLQEGLDDLNSDVVAAVKVKAANVVAAEELTGLFKNLVDIVKTAAVGDVYESDAANLEEDRAELLGRINVELGYIAEYLLEGKVVENYETSKGAYDVMAEDVNGFLGKIKDAEKVLADNKLAQAELVSKLGEIEATLKGIVLNPEALYEDDYEALFEKYDALRELVETAQEEIKVAFAEKTATEYDLDGNLNVKLVELLGAKMEAENVWAANVEGKNALLSYMQTLLTTINTTLAVTKCAECDPDQTGTIEDLYNEVADVEALINAAFNDKKTAKEVAGSEFRTLYVKLYEYELKLAEIKASIEETNDTVVFSEKAKDNILDKMLDFEFILSEAQELEGADHFLVRNTHCSNPNVLYFDEIRKEIADLKAQVEYDNSHNGGHTAFDNYNAYVKQVNAIKEYIKNLEAAIEANEAAKALIDERYAELYADALDAYNFWHKYYTEFVTLTDTSSDPASRNGDWYTANKGWIQEYNGELKAGDYLVMVKNYFDDLYQHGNAANAWTVDAQGKELNTAATETFEQQDADLAKDRNILAYYEAKNHYNAVRQYVDYEYQMLRGEYDNYDYWTDTWTKDPFTADVMDLFLDEIEGEFGVLASLNTYWQDILAAKEEGVMEDDINIDERNHALGIHQQLGGVKSVFNGILAEYKDLFEDAHHLTNGKKIYSDQEYFTLGFFKKANDGSVENGQEMFKEVKVLVNDDIRLYDSRSYVWNDMGTPDDWSDDEALVDEKGRVVYDKENYAGEIAEVTVLTVGQKSNELSFNFHQNPMALERTTLKAGTAEVDFLPGSISVKNDNIDTWVVKHTVSIDGLDVLTPEVADMTPTVYAASNKLIVRLDAPIDLTYTINSLVARTDDGTEFSYADRELNYAARTIEFTLPEGTASVDLPEGFFTFRTGENSIARSAAMVVAVGGTQTSIDALIAMGEKAQVFDLQGRRVNVETLVKGNTYVVNGVKTIVK